MANLLKWSSKGKRSRPFKCAISQGVAMDSAQQFREWLQKNLFMSISDNLVPLTHRSAEQNVLNPVILEKIMILLI